MSTKNIQSSKLPAPWRAFVNSEEKQRLKVLAERRERKSRIIDAEIAIEERRIMNRCIHRMRRKAGKT